MNEVDTRVSTSQRHSTREFVIKVVFLSAIAAACPFLIANTPINTKRPIGMPAQFHSEGTDDKSLITIARCDEIVRVNPEVIFFGDSTVLPMDPDETDRRTTVEKFAEMQRACTVGGFYGAALTPEFFAQALMYFQKRGCTPRTVVVPVNIRAFSESWRGHPAYQFAGLRVFLEHDSYWTRALDRPKALLGVYERDKPNRADYFRSVHQLALDSPAFPAYAATLPKKGNRMRRVRDFAYYGLPIDERHELLKSFVALRDIAQSMNARLVCYMCPIDYDNVRQELNDGASGIAAQNVRFVSAWLRENGFNVIDLSNAVPPQLFFPVGVTSSHLVAEGRLLLAQTLTQRFQNQALLTCS